MQTWEGLGMENFAWLPYDAHHHPHSHSHPHHPALALPPLTHVPLPPEYAAAAAAAYAHHAQHPHVQAKTGLSDSTTDSASVWPSPRTEGGEADPNVGFLTMFNDVMRPQHRPQWISMRPQQQPHPPQAHPHPMHPHAAHHQLATQQIHSLPRSAPTSPEYVRERSTSTSGHSKGRPWRCPVDGCGRTYRFKGDLKYHVQHKHVDRPELPSQISRPRSDKVGKEYPCPWTSCASGFKWERDLKRHIKVKHGIDPDGTYWPEMGTTRYDERAEGKGKASLEDGHTEDRPRTRGLVNEQLGTSVSGPKLEDVESEHEHTYVAHSQLPPPAGTGISAPSCAGSTSSPPLVAVVSQDAQQNIKPEAFYPY